MSQRNQKIVFVVTAIAMTLLVTATTVWYQIAHDRAERNAKRAETAMKLKEITEKLDEERLGINAGMANMKAKGQELEKAKEEDLPKGKRRICRDSVPIGCSTYDRKVQC